MLFRLEPNDIKRLFQFRQMANKRTLFFLEAFLIGLIKLFFRVINSLLKTRKKFEVLPRIEQVFIVLTQNHSNISKFLINDLGKSNFLVIGHENYLNTNYFLKWSDIEYHKSLNFSLKNLFYLEKGMTQDLDRAICLNQILNGIDDIFKKIKPKNIIFFCDHDFISSIIQLYVNKFKNEIRTSYVQHGFVNKNFPPLSFDFYFSYGTFSSSQYNLDNRFKNCKIFNCGKVIEFKSFKKVNNVIGISLNTLDNEKKILELILHLLTKYKFSILIRPHPRSRLSKFFLEKLRNLNIEIDQSDTILKYFQKITFNISSESSIHVDSLFYDIPSLYYPLSGIEKYFDYYGFLKSNLIEMYDFKKTEIPKINWSSEEFRRKAKNF